MCIRQYIYIHIQMDIKFERTTFSYAMEKFFRVFGFITTIVYIFTYIGINVPIISVYFERVHTLTKMWIGIIFILMYNPIEWIRTKFNNTLHITRETKRIFAFTSGCVMLLSSGLDVLILRYSKRIDLQLKQFLSQ
jgi:hypothetical protein